ncbi:MAG: diaminopimelate epimerase [Gaiellaceae bacterium]
MRFSKWHALGNSYLLVERAELPASLSPDDARRLCDRDRGIGADGVLEIVSVRGPEAEVVIWNPDGSRAELSGNGVRIAAMWLARRSGVAFPRVHIGERVISARLEGEDVEVDLGLAEVGRPEALDVDGERLEFTPVAVGNPHAVLRREPVREELLRLGPLIERHERFPSRTNVQFVRVDGSNDLTVVVWERGAGATLASGSSAAAAAAAALAHGWCEAPVRVHLPGGTLTVDVREGRAVLTGPVREIFRGETV